LAKVSIDRGGRDVVGVGRVSERHPPPIRPYSLPWRRAAALLAAILAGLETFPLPESRAAEPPTVPAAAPHPVVNATWTALPLRQAADRLAAIAGRPIVVDRRIDPGVPITRDMRDEPLDETLSIVAAAGGGEVASLRSSIRIVPAGAGTIVERAEAARERRIAALPSADRRHLAQRRVLEWPDGGRPRDIVEAVAAEAGVSLTGLDALPHDHFPRGSLPPLSLAERLDLLLAHFDRRIEWKTGADGRPVGTIVPIATGLEQAAAPPRTAGDGRQRPKRPAPQTATARQPAAPPTFSLRLEAPLDQALAAIAGRLGLAVAIDHESLRARGLSAGEIVRAEVKDKPRDALLDAVLAPLDLRWSIDGKTLRVSAGPPDPPPR
jgi:hypothetical protein